MKKLLLLLAIISMVFFYDSCTKDKTIAPPDCTANDTLNTYTKSVKEIMDLNCAYAGCHDPITHESGLILDTYDGVTNAAKTNINFFCTIDHTCTPYMPYALPKLEDSLITKIEAWKANCYAQ